MTCILYITDSSHALGSWLEGLPGQRDAAGHLVGELAHHAVLLLRRPVLRRLEEAAEAGGPHAGHELRGDRGLQHLGVREPREPRQPLMVRQ